ncbi:MAG TPA: IS66 family transposase, partial [Polyangiaceae bacterium]|nr:IS66 family transposase [Polyangiaceae bacterium]
MGQPESVDPITSALMPNLEAVRRFIVDMVKRGSITLLVSAVLGLLARMNKLNVELVAKLQQSRRKRPPSETTRRLQLELPFLVKKADNDSQADGQNKQKKKRGPRTRDRHGRPKLPAHLLRVPIPHRVPDAQRTCPTCQVEARPIGNGRIIETLEVIPAQHVVHQHIYETLGCPCCHQYMVRADKPDEVVARGLLGNELLVQATVDHYQDAVPWERMERRARQEGMPLCANTLASSCGKLIDLLDPIVRDIFDKCVRSSYFAFDATSIPVLDSAAPIGIRTGALWLMQGDHCFSSFFYAESGHAKHLEDKLKGYKLSSAMCDGSATNNLIERAGASRGGCNAHARRKLVEALRLGDVRATAGIELFGKLFHIEADAKRAGDSLAQRFERRQQHSAPVVAELDRWVKDRVEDVEPKSKLGRAVRYIRKQWKRLTRFLHDPLMELSNNEVER